MGREEGQTLMGREEEPYYLTDTMEKRYMGLEAPLFPTRRCSHPSPALYRVYTASYMPPTARCQCHFEASLRKS